jgi:mono/diheme cytochrome c family protein
MILTGRTVLRFYFQAVLLCAAVAAADEVEQGAYLVKIAGCADCHTVSYDEPMAGGYRLQTPFGDFFTPNITPDPDTGIGRWTERQFHDALRFGVSPNGAIYFPAFPYRSFTKISDRDLHRIYLYLRSLTPIANPNRAHRLKIPFNQRWLMYFWQWLYFNGRISNRAENIKDGIGPFIPDPTRSPRWNRGAYLAEALAHCAECHTPRNSLGHLLTSQWMSGTFDILRGPIPNITPDPETGLGRWTTENWMVFLTSGLTPELHTPAHEMAEVIQNTSSLTEQDRKALVEYLTSLPRVHHALD